MISPGATTTEGDPLETRLRDTSRSSGRVSSVCSDILLFMTAGSRLIVDESSASGAFSPIPASQNAEALATLVSAFSDDPVERWLWPETQSYLDHFPTFLAAFGGESFTQQTAWRVGDCSAVALWLPPGAEADGEAVVAVLTETVAPELHADVFAVMEQIDAAHPRYEHWYLPWLGVRAAEQGQGLGGELLRACLRVVDASHLPAYLETPNPRTISFYGRHGFVVTGVTQTEACPPLSFMLRSAR